MSQSQHDLRPEGAPDVNDPFLLALRYGDAEVGETSLAEAVARQGLDLKVLEYAAEQRAIRMIFQQSGREDELVHGTAPPMTPGDRALLGALVPLYMDALLAGWRARAIVEAEGKDSH